MGTYCTYTTYIRLTSTSYPSDSDDLMQKANVSTSLRYILLFVMPEQFSESQGSRIRFEVFSEILRNDTTKKT